MRIAVLGTGVVGQTIAAKLEELGHDVTVGTRDVEGALARADNDSFGRPPFAAWHEQHPGIHLSDYAEAAASGEIIINATNGGGTLSALRQAGKDNLGDKVLLDISNPLDFSKGMPPSLFVCNTDSLAEQIQREFPEVKVVKSLNTMNAVLMVNPALLLEDHHTFISGNDPEAKVRVKELLKAFGWKERNIVDMGDISSARGLEQVLPLWVRLFGTLKTPMFNFKIVIADLPKG